MCLAAGFLPGEPSNIRCHVKTETGPSLYPPSSCVRAALKREEKAQSQQYLTPSEEKAPESFLKVMFDFENPVLIKFLPSVALSIAHQHSTTNRAYILF
jgi:hypothetical protein